MNTYIEEKKKKIGKELAQLAEDYTYDYTNAVDGKPRLRREANKLVEQLIKDTIAYCEENTRLEKKEQKPFPHLQLKESYMEGWNDAIQDYEDKYKVMKGEE